MEIGQIFELKYKIVRVLGKGGMSTVYLAENMNLHSYFAIKEVNKTQNSKIDLLAEPLILTKLKHAALPKIFDIVENDEHLFIIEEYIEGISLEEELSRVKQFNEETIVTWTREICDLLKYLHNRNPNPIIYRDMKPSNLMITVEGQIKLIDFGIAREYKKDSGSDTTYMGTRGYAAPEQYGTTQTDARTDIFGLGVTLYHLITGKSPNEPPFEIKPVRELNKNLSVGIEHIIKKCTQQDPNARYQNIEALLVDLENINEFDKSFRRARNISRTPIVVSILFLLCSSFLVGFGGIEIQKEALDRYFSKVELGLEAVSTKGIDQALVILHEAIELEPDQEAAYEEIGMLYIADGKYLECKDFFLKDNLTSNEAIQNNSNIHYILGTAFFELKEYKNAIESFSRASRIDPTNIDYKRDLAVCYARNDEIPKAKTILTELEVLNSRTDAVTYIQGEIALKQGKSEDAIIAFNESILLSNDETLKRRAVVTIAQTQNANSEFEEEIRGLEYAITILNKKNDPVILEMLGSAYFSKAISIGSDGASYIYDLEKAKNSFQQLLNSGVKRAYIYRNIGIIDHYRGDFVSSEAIFNEMASLYPEDFRPYYELALLFADQENLKENEQRDYTKTFKNYELAMKYSNKEQQQSELMPLTNLISELQSKGWK